MTVHLMESSEQREQRAAPAPPLPALDLSGAGVLNRDDFTSQLKAAIYGASRGQHPAGTLTPNAMKIIAENPGRLLSFDRLRELLGRAAGNELLLLSPVSVLCPLHGPRCKNGQILLSPANTLDKLEQHLRLAHVGEERAAALLSRLEHVRARPYSSLSELAEVAPFELSPADRQPTGRRDLLLRPPPRRLHWVPRWLNVLLTEPRESGGEPHLTLRHVLVQMLIFLLFLVFPHAAWSAMWGTQLPHLFHFAGALLYISKEMGYRLACGRVLFCKGRKTEVFYPISRWQSSGSEDGLVVVEVAEHQAWMVRFGEAGTLLRCEHAPSLRFAIHRRVVAPSAGAPLQLELRVISGEAALLDTGPPDQRKLRRERKVECIDINIPLPPPKDVKAAELPARHTSGPNFHVIAAFLEIAPTLSPPPPMLRNEEVCVVLVSQKFDKRPLNQCAYVHVGADEHGVPSATLLGVYEKADDGALTVFTADRCRELVDAGPTAMRRALARGVYVSDVEETSTTTLDEALTLNTHTSYTTAGGKHVAIIEELAERRRQLGACLACILAGDPDGCDKSSLVTPCSRCASASPRICCTSAHSVFDACDAASEQHKAINSINDEADAAQLPLSSIKYQRGGIVALHMLKNKIGGFCNYALLNSTSAEGGELSLTMLRAIACGADHDLAEKLVSARAPLSCSLTSLSLSQTSQHPLTGNGQRRSHLQGQALGRARVATLPAGRAVCAGQGRDGQGAKIA